MKQILSSKQFKRVSSALIALAAGLACKALLAADAAPTAAAVDQRVDQLLSQLTLDEKISLLHGYDNFYTGEVKRLNIPRIKMTDGPVGTRNDGASTAYPAGAMLAATWDPAMGMNEGVALGRDARSRGDHILLGPGVNIYRQPQNGRNFEYLGEDPFLTAQMDVGYIRGVQSQGVGACVKHYACNNQEIERGSVDVQVDERTLHEIYLPAFEAAVKFGHVVSIMASYNRINSHYATANHYLLTEVLRTEWGFDGIAMSDWGAVHETLGPMTAGLDLEMPDPHYFNAKTLQPLLDSGKIKQTDIDEKVRHLLHVEVEMGWMDHPQMDASISRRDDANNETALEVAREGIVLLKNEGKLLPLDRSKVHKLVLLGPSADSYIAGGGSSFTSPARRTTIKSGLTSLAEKFGGDLKITSIPFADQSDRKISQLAQASEYEALDNDKPPLIATFFNSKDLTGDPVQTRADKAIDFNWQHKLPVTEIASPAFSVRWKGTIKPKTTGNYVFMIRSDDGSRVLLDGKEIVDNWRDQAAHTAAQTLPLEVGHSYALTVEYYNSVGDASVQFAYFPVESLLSAEQTEEVRGADAAVVCVHTDESEGGDRAYDLPSQQQMLITEASALNPHTVVVLEAGGNVGMNQWIDHVPALVDAWYPGQAGGQAIAEVLFGEINPSGHLPDTFEKQWPDSPAFGNYPGSTHVDYVEGIYVGYRWYDKKKIEPRFPFGFGLSYTTFEVKNLTIAPGSGPQNFNATVAVANTGARPGAAIAQLYVRPPANSRVDRPVQELKGFSRVELKPGESRTVSIPLDPRSFSHWDTATHNWKVEPGDYEIAVGQSSRDITATATVQIK